VIYRLYFHPLASFPGPKLYAASYFPFLFAEKIQGTFFRDVAALHERYGPIVRIAPNRLAIEPEIAWKEIFAHNGSRHEFFRDKKFFRNPDSLIAAYTEDHRRQRRQVASAFSESALYQQEVHIMKYVNLLMERLKEKADARMAVDLVKWFNFIAFDVIGDLTFAESFGCLETGDYHPWIAVIFASVKSASNLQFVMHYPLLRPLAWYMLGWDGLEKGKMHREVGRQRAEKRIARGPVEDRKDFMTYILRDNNPGSKTGMTHEEIVQNTGLFMGAGSETTAGAMAGLIFHLTQAPHAYETLTEEIRSRFQSEDEINMRAVTKLPYLQACIEEGLRMYSPVPDMAPRVSTGETVAGRYIPKEVSVMQNPSITPHWTHQPKLTWSINRHL
jgi:cytochrome P450